MVSKRESGKQNLSTGRRDVVALAPVGKPASNSSVYMGADEPNGRNGCKRGKGTSCHGAGIDPAVAEAALKLLGGLYTASWSMRLC